MLCYAVMLQKDATAGAPYAAAEVNLLLSVKGHRFQKSLRLQVTLLLLQAVPPSWHNSNCAVACEPGDFGCYL
jgi:hypothetical protein